MDEDTKNQDAYPTMSGAGDSRKVGMSTFLIHGKAQTARWDFSHHTVPPLSSSVTYRLDSAERGGRGVLQFGRRRDEDEAPVYIYDRLDEPTRSILEDDLAKAEGGDVCCTFSTGMAAISAALGILLKPGDHIVAYGTMYGCTYSLLTRWLSRLQISTTFCDFTDLARVRAAIRPETRVLYAETPANPTMEIVDLGALCALRDEVNASRPDDRTLHVLIDNTFASPYCQRPLEWGVDMVIESLTKNICGFGTDMGGAVICGKRYEEDLFMYRKDFGGVLSPKSDCPPSPCGPSGRSTPPRKLPSSWNSTRRSPECTTPASPATRNSTWPRSKCGAPSAPSPPEPCCTSRRVRTARSPCTPGA